MKPTTKQNTCKFCGQPIPLSYYCCRRCWKDFEEENQETIKHKNATEAANEGN